MIEITSIISLVSARVSKRFRVSPITARLFLKIKDYFHGRLPWFGTVSTTAW